MKRPIIVADLFKHLQVRLQLKWVAGEDGFNTPIEGLLPGTGNQTLVGHLNCIHPSRIQVIGRCELVYLTDLSQEAFQDFMAKLFAEHPAAILFSDGIDVDPIFRRLAEVHGTPLLSSPLPDHQLVNYINYFLTSSLADRETIYGVFMEVMGLGVLLTGDPASGKSELALELITRGHRLIADDMVDFSRVAPDTLQGSCPPMLIDLLEVRGLGILNVREMFGNGSIKPMKFLRLIIHLQRMSQQELQTMERLQEGQMSRTLLGVEIPLITIPVAPGRNLAILVEAAVRQHLLHLKGYDALQDLEERQRRLMGAATAEKAAEL